MPIYQYDCPKCEKRVDVFFRSISKVTDPVCPECGGKKLKRVMSKVMRARSDADRIDDIDINQELGRLGGSMGVGDFARWSKDLGKRYDKALGSDFGSLSAQADAGQDPVERVDAGHALRYRLEQAKMKATAKKRPKASDLPPSNDPYGL